MNANKIRTVLKRGVVSALLKKLKERGVYWWPHNIKKYRPTSAINLRERSSDFSSVCLYADDVSETYIPSALHDVMLSKNYDRVDRSVEPYRMYSEQCDFFVASLPEGRLVTDNLRVVAYITRGNRVLSDVSFQYVKGRGAVSADESPVLRQRYFKEPKRIKGRSFAMLAGGLSGRGNYYHWIIDVLPRLHCCKKRADGERRSLYRSAVCPRFSRGDTSGVWGET